MLAVILVIVVGTIRLIGSNANNVFSQVGSAIQYSAIRVSTAIIKPSQSGMPAACDKPLRPNLAAGGVNSIERFAPNESIPLTFRAHYFRSGAVRATLSVPAVENLVR